MSLLGFLSEVVGMIQRLRSLTIEVRRWRLGALVSTNKYRLTMTKHCPISYLKRGLSLFEIDR
jgi:hypothetical protein